MSLRLANDLAARGLLYSGLRHGMAGEAFDHRADLERLMLYGRDPVDEAVDAYVYGDMEIEELERRLDRALGLTPRPRKVDWLEDELYAA